MCSMHLTSHHAHPSAVCLVLHCRAQGIVGVRFKRLIMDDAGLMPKSREPRPPQETDYKRVVFSSGKVRCYDCGG
jgi:hypothetical protein